MTRNGRARREARNTALLWEKMAVVLSAPLAAILFIALLHTGIWGPASVRSPRDRRDGRRGMADGQAARRTAQPEELGSSAAIGG